MDEVDPGMCPICTEPFRDNEMVIECHKWDKGTFLAHIDCALALSRGEKGRKHPPPPR